VAIIDSLTGEVRMAEIFVAVLGASHLTYAEASSTQTLPDWIAAHIRMFRFWGGAPRLLVPDNLKSGVNKASFYDPEVNRSYGKMATHYNVGILPTRPRKPKDKAAVEVGVRFAQSYILGRLRYVTFFSLAECNAAILAALDRMNGRVMRRLGVSRRQLFDTIERPAMQPLPESDYEYADWHLARVGIDYHVEVRSFLYSVSHALVREQVDTRATARTVEIFHRGKRVAAHARRYAGPRHGTLPDHMPSAHRRYAEWTPERFTRVLARPRGAHDGRCVCWEEKVVELNIVARVSDNTIGRTPFPAPASPRPRVAHRQTVCHVRFQGLRMQNSIRLSLFRLMDEMQACTVEGGH
jgi:transposase